MNLDMNNDGKISKEEFVEGLLTFMPSGEEFKKFMEFLRARDSPAMSSTHWRVRNAEPIGDHWNIGELTMYHGSANSLREQIKDVICSHNYDKHELSVRHDGVVANEGHASQRMWAGADGAVGKAVGGSWLGFEFDEPVQVNEVELAQAGVSCQQVENIWLEYLSMEDGRWLKAANLTVPMPNGRISVEELSSEAAAVDPAEGIAADMRPGCEECAQLLDTDNDGFISKEECEVAFGSMSKDTWSHDYLMNLDMNNDGKISKEEFVEGLLTFMPSGEEFKKFMEFLRARDSPAMSSTHWRVRNAEPIGDHWNIGELTMYHGSANSLREQIKDVICSHNYDKHELSVIHDGVVANEGHASQRMWAGADGAVGKAVGGSWLGFEFDEPVQVNEVELAQAGVSCQQVENIWLEYLSMEDGRWLKAANLTVPMPNGRISVEELSSEAAAVDPAEGIAADMRPGCEECAQLLDTDNDGFISKEECEVAFGSMSKDTWSNDYLMNLDMNNDGKISKEEFVEGLLTFMPSGEEFKKFMEFLRPGKIHQEQPLEQEEMERSQAAYDIDVALDADMSRIRMLRQP